MNQSDRGLASRPSASILVASLALLLLAALCLAQPARGDVSVKAELSDTQTEVNQAVDLSITITGGEGTVPENVDADGLSITYSGHSTQMQITFGNLFGSGAHGQNVSTYTYSVVPQRPGHFVIPGIPVDVDGRHFTTKPINLTVMGQGGSQGGGGGTQGSSGISGSANADRASASYFAELIVPKQHLYIGEVLPAEVKIYIDERIPNQPETPPDIQADSCTVQKLTKPMQSEVDRDGRRYQVVTFKTAITAARAGKIRLGPATTSWLMQFPQTRRRGGPFGNSMFDDPVLDEMLRRTGPTQRVAIKADPVELDVKPLPAADQPRSFAGAVGHFSMTTSVKPTMVEAGDPITLTAKIEGEGDFDRVTGPQLADPAGWRTYPPSSKFTADDDVGISGAKTFEQAIIAQEKKTASPTLEWSYFDPDRERYVTLKGAPVPITMEGQPQPSPAPLAQGAPASSPGPAPSAARPDIAYIQTESTGWGATFAPLYTRPVFWEAQAAPLLALLAFIGMHISQARAADLRARERAQWRREKEAAVAVVHRRGGTEREYYEAAARALRLEAALGTGRPAQTLDTDDVVRSRILDESTAAKVRDVFARHGEVLYAGGSGTDRPASAETQAELLDLVKKYENAKPAV